MSAPTEHLASAPPHSEDAERAVLGCAFLEAGAYHEAADVLRREFFYRESHRHIWRAIGETLTPDMSSADPIAVCDYLDARQFLDDVGGPHFVTSLTFEVPSAVRVRHYAELVREKWRLRELARTALDIATLATEGQSSADDLMNDLGDRMLRLEHVDEDETHIRSILKKLFRRAERALSGEESDARKYPCGIWPVDALMQGGFAGGMHYVIGADSGHGKTSMAAGIVSGLLRNTSAVLDWFSLEMPREETTARILSSYKSIPEKWILDPTLVSDAAAPEFWDQLIQANHELVDRRIWVDDKTSDVRRVTQRIAAMRARYRDEPYIVVIDYVQLLDDRQQGRGVGLVEKIAGISRQLRNAGRNHGVIMFVLTQFTNESKVEPHPMPHPKSARWSKEVHNDSTHFMIYHRPWNESRPRYAVLQLAKARSGDRLSHVSLRGDGLRHQWEWWPDRSPAGAVPNLNTPEQTRSQ